MTFQEFLNEKNKKYEQIKLKEALFDEKNNKLTLYLVYPDEPNFLLDENREEINKLSKEFIQEINVELNIEYRKSYIDKNVVFDEIKNVLSKNFFMWVNSINKEDIELNIKESIIKIKLNVTKSLNNSALTNQIKKELVNYFDNSFCQTITIDIVVSKSDDEFIKEEEKLMRKQCALNLLKSVNQVNGPLFLEVEYLGDIIGEIKNYKPQRLDTINDVCDNLAVAGKIKRFMKRSYIKNNRNGEEIEKFYYVFDLHDEYGLMPCVIFPKEEDLIKIDAFVEDLQIMVLGQVERNEKNSKFKMRIKSVARCVLPPYTPKKIEYISEFPNYLQVIPENYFEEKQITLMMLNLKDDYCDYLLKNEVVVFDLETTGFSSQSCYIIEIGAVKIKNGKLIESFSSLIKPPELIPNEITEITNITNEMVQNAPSFELVLADFYKFTRKTIISGYNVKFDNSFLQKYSQMIGLNFDNEFIDTMALAKKKIKGISNYQLKTVVKALNIELVNAHRALNDAVATAKAFIKLID